MASKNESTMKWKVDIKELKAAMQDAKRSISLATAEFKTATAGMDKWSKSSEGLEAKIKQLNSTLPQQKTILEQLEKQYELTVKNMGENSAEAQRLKIQIENQKAAINKTEASIDKYNDQLGDMKAKEAEANSETGKLSKTIEEQEKALAALKKEYANAVLKYGENSDEAKNLAKQIEDLSGELNSNKTKLKDAEKAADQFDKSLENVEDQSDKTSSGFSAMTVALGNLIADGIRKAITAMSDFIKESIEVGKNFDASMSQVAAVSGATADELSKLRNKAKEMGATTKFTASETAEAFNYMAMAGWKTEDMLTGIDGVLNLAAASGADLATTSDIVTDALTAMGYSAGDAGKLADVMAAASSNANTNVEMMGSTFKYAAPIIGAMGYNMEDAAVAIGLMANAGIKGEMAGTALRSVLSRLAAPPKECADAMSELGISLTDNEGNMKSLDEVMGDLRKAFSGLSETQQTQLAKSIAGQEAMSGLLAIVNASPDDFDKLTGAVKNSNGAAKEMAETMLDNLGGDMTLLKSKLEGVQIALYEKFEPAMRAGVAALDSLLDAVQFVVDHSTEFVAALTAMAAGVAAYLAYTTALTVMTQGWQALTIVTKAQTAAQAALNAVMALNPIGLVVAAVVALIAAFVVLWNKSEGFRTFWIELWETVKETAQAAWEAISGFFSDAWNTIQEVWGTITEFFSGLWESVKEIFSTIASWIDTNVFQPIIKFFQPVIKFFGTAWSIIYQLAQGCWNAIKLVWQVVSAWFNEHIIIPVKGFFSGLWTTVSTAASTAWTTIKNVWNAVSGWFNNTIIEPVKKFFGDMWDKVSSGASDAWEGIKSVFGSIADWFEEKFSTAWEKVKNVFSTGGKVFEGIKDGIVSAFKTVVNAIIRGINKVISIPFNAINNALDKIRNVSIVGAKPFENLVSRFTVPQIPELAQGGVLKRGQVGLLEGDGAEAVVPLEKNKKWINAIVRELIVQMDNVKGSVNGSVNGLKGDQIINFNQTINSPKAVDRLTLYQETNNLLFSAKVRLGNV